MVKLKVWIPAGNAELKHDESTTVLLDIVILQLANVNDADAILTLPNVIVDGNIIDIVPPVGIGSSVLTENKYEVKA